MKNREILEFSFAIYLTLMPAPNSFFAACCAFVLEPGSANDFAEVPNMASRPAEPPRFGFQLIFWEFSTKIKLFDLIVR